MESQVRRWDGGWGALSREPGEEMGWGIGLGAGWRIKAQLFGLQPTLLAGRVQELRCPREESLGKRRAPREEAHRAQWVGLGQVAGLSCLVRLPPLLGRP